MRLLDLFCGAGGAAAGYARAGFDVTGVDVQRQPNYPFKFVREDAIRFVKRFGNEFDVIHASPPCQAYSVLANANGNRHQYPALIADTRHAIGRRPYVIENVMGAKPHFHLHRSIFLCGTMFGLRVLRHRLFEFSENIHLPAQPHHKTHPKGRLTGACHGYSRFAEYDYICVAGNNFNRADGMRAMGVTHHCTRRELAQMIPPAYAEWIGQHLMACLKKENEQ